MIRLKPILLFLFSCSFCSAQEPDASSDTAPEAETHVLVSKWVKVGIPVFLGCLVVYRVFFKKQSSGSRRGNRRRACSRFMKRRRKRPLDNFYDGASSAEDALKD